MKNHYITTLLLSLVALSSCSDEREGITLTGNAATFTPLISGLEPAAGSRASGGDWQVNDRVGVFMLASGDDTFPALADNREYFATASGGNTALLPASSGQTIYYPMDDSGVTFMAYYPYTSSLGDDETNPVYAVDLTDQSSLEDLDLLYHKGTAVYSNALPNATLNFEHQLVKVEISVVRGTGIDTPLTNMAIKLKGMSATADFELATGKLANEGDAADIVPGTLTATADEAYYAAVLLPQDAVEGRTVAFSLGSLSYSYEFPDDLDFEKGKIYTLAFAFGEAEATFMGITIRDWATAVGVDGYEVNLPLRTYSFSREEFLRQSLIVKTNYPFLPLIRFSSSATDPDAGVTGGWLYQSIPQSADEPTYYKAGTEDGTHAYELLFDVEDNYSSGVDREAFIHITIGSRTMVVPVTQGCKDIMSYVYKQPESNCYIVHPGGVGIAFPVSRANTFWESTDGGGTTPIGAATVFDAELLWTDIKGSNETGIAPDAAIRHIQTYGTGKDAHIIVEPGTHEGNALIAVKVGGEIKWSWHIWVTAYNPWVNDNPIAYSMELMDRNLGATIPQGYYTIKAGTEESYGLYYQWGRKDPFVGPNSGKGLYTSTTATMDQTVNQVLTTVPQSVQQPTVFYAANMSSIYHWLEAQSGVYNPYLWNEETTGYKTLYDPCPVGWRVSTVALRYGYLAIAFDAWATPQQQPWAVDDDNNIWPSAGFRHWNGGNFFNSPGTLTGGGINWTAVPSGDKAKGTRISRITINYEQDEHRSSGGSVRCEKE